jgi:hypothetical protein
MPRFTLGKVAVRAIHDAVSKLFARVKTRILGPSYVRMPKRIVFASAPHRPDFTLPAIYDAATETQGFKPTPALREHVATTVGLYLDAYEEKAKALVTQRVQATLHEAEQGGVKTNFGTVLGGHLEELMGKLGEEVGKMAGTEATRARNMGKLDGISKVASSQGIDDPTVFWVVVNDASLCPECRRLHLLDAVTPRVWKLSEVGHAYHKRGDPSPKVGGLHPWCRCDMNQLLPDYGFDAGGKVKFIAFGHDEYARQRGL